MLISLAMRCTGSREDAEDIVQDALIKAYTHIDKFRGDAKFSSWLYRITINQVRMSKRGAQYNFVSLDSVVPKSQFLTYTQTLRAREDSPEDKAAQAEILEVIAWAADSLARCERECFNMIYYRGLLAREAAEERGTCVNTVKASTFRAMAKVRVRVEAAL